jgi:hypothetical protein
VSDTSPCDVETVDAHLTAAARGERPPAADPVLALLTRWRRELDEAWSERIDVPNHR